MASLVHVEEQSNGLFQGWVKCQGRKGALIAKEEKRPFRGSKMTNSTAIACMLHGLTRSCRRKLHWKGHTSSTYQICRTADNSSGYCHGHYEPQGEKNGNLLYCDDMAEITKTRKNVKVEEAVSPLSMGAEQHCTTKAEE